jgi:hypothetical protein
MQSTEIQPNMRFGCWITLQRNYVPAHVMWLCRCECGVEREVWDFSLVRGQSLSCGCLHKKLLVRRLTTHAMTHSREYRIWRSMKQRCHNPKCSSYKYYGARGIKVCERWRNSFVDFYADMGPSNGLEIDRINNDGNYEPSNCRWATREQQMRNKRPVTTCNNGHIYTEDNIYIAAKHQHRQCRMCKRDRSARYKAKLQAFA